MTLDPSFADARPFLLEGAVRNATREIASPLFSLDPSEPGAARELESLADNVASFCRLAGTRSRTGFFVLSTLVLWAMRLRSGGSRELSRRSAALSRVEHGPLAPAFHGVKALLCIIYFEDVEVVRRMGLETGCLTAPKGAS